MKATAIMVQSSKYTQSAGLIDFMPNSGKNNFDNMKKIEE
jgi:hypothetical protein